MLWNKENREAAETTFDSPEMAGISGEPCLFPEERGIRVPLNAALYPGSTGSKDVSAPANFLKLAHCARQEGLGEHQCR